jgi:single-stranded-DNA-specific exonuclease
LGKPFKASAEGRLSPLLQLLLENRGVKGAGATASFLSPTLSSMADPMGLTDMAEAVVAVVNAIMAGDRIVVYGDYDADGLTAAALLLRFFKEIGVEAGCYIPDRVTEGYGLNKGAVAKIAATGCRLLITVDCGSSNREEIAFARSLGMKVVVTDHHRLRCKQTLPCPFVNPNRDPDIGGLADLSGVGVAFFLAVALRAALRERGWFKKRAYPDLKAYLDLVALGTIADRSNVLGQNRILISNGIRFMQEPKWRGIRALREISLLNGRAIDSEAVAFRLAPRLNAAGRVGDARLGLDLLMEDDEVKASGLARALDSANVKRQNLERQTLKEAEDILCDQGAAGHRKALVACAPGWHRGIVGLVASRLAERYRRPALVFSLEDDMAVGSGRSIEGFNLFGALERLEGLLERFGGHSQAAGVTIRKDNLERFTGELDALAGDGLTPEMMLSKLMIDCELPLEDVGPGLVNQIETLRPFGEGNPEPLFLARSVEFLRGYGVGAGHLKMTLRCKGKVMDGMGFSLDGYLHLAGRPVDIVYRPEYNARTGGIRLRVADLRASTL